MSDQPPIARPRPPGIPRITAEDISVKTIVQSEIEVETWCDVCDELRAGSLLCQHWVHGSLYVCPECRGVAGIETETERLRRFAAVKEKKRNEEQGG
jgi:hypothetical protein